jgi:hypothetical protein
VILVGTHIYTVDSELPIQKPSTSQSFEKIILTDVADHPVSLFSFSSRVRNNKNLLIAPIRMHERVFQVVCSAGNPTYNTPMTTRNLGLIIFPSATLEKIASLPILFFARQTFYYRYF